ncbi:MAG: DUF3987 domain-containing protein, partial [bacterium]|nr:DUF3987 domain-containing protein [bacterium]
KNLSPANPTVGAKSHWGVITKVYDYYDEDGNVLFRVCRTSSKDFPIARPDSRSRTGWYWGIEDVERVLYNLPAVLEAVETGRTIYIVEGEKDADAINKHDPDTTAYVATTAPLGAGNWRPEYADALVGAKHVVIWADRFDKDNQGLDHAVDVAKSLKGRVESIELVQSKEGKDASDHLSAGHGLDEVVLIEPNSQESPLLDAGRGAEWSPPIPFRSHELPEFPVDDLPEPLSEFARAESLATQTPVDLAGCLVLSACAVGLGGRYRVEVRSGWDEPTNLFVVVVLDSGNRKSAVVSDTTGPILVHERSEWERLESEIREAETHRRILQKRLREAEKAASKADPSDREQLERLAIEAANELGRLHVPPRPRLIADDVTPEKLAELVSEHGGRFAVLSAEGGVFELLAGRYSNNSSPNFDVFLKGHAGDPLRVDRIGRSPDRVDRPALTVGLAVQNDVLRGLASKPGFRGRGLLARFLYSIPVSPLGRRMINAPPVPDSVRRIYHRLLTDILETRMPTDELGRPTAHTLRFDEHAAKRFQAFEASIEPQLAPFGDLAAMTDWGSKLAGATARLCGIIHVTKLVGDVAPPYVRRIDLDTVNRAIGISEYFVPHALAAFGEMGADPEVENARHVLAWISRWDKQSFSERDAYQGLKGRFKKMADLRPALRLLMEHEYIRERPQEKQDGPGRRPSPTYDVNPNSEDIGNIGDRNKKAISDLPPLDGTQSGTKSTFDSHPHNPQYPQNSSDDDDQGEAA